MSDSNAGARKGKNCRNHSFIVNGILHEKKENHGEPIDILIYDVAKCFDEVWPADTINILYDLGVKNENLCIIYEGTQKSYISIKTTSGQTERFEVGQLVAQGSTWGPLMTSASIDTIGKDAQQSGQNCYSYKSVKIPPLSFVDDVSSINKCGVDSIVTNSVINTKIQCKKLRLGTVKCHQMHIGEESDYCPILSVNQKQNNDVMEKVKEDTFLGGLISDSCNNEKKLAKATNKGIGISSVIMAMLQEISFGSHLFEIHCKIFIIVTKSLYFIKVYIVFYQGIFWFIPK